MVDIPLRQPGTGAIVTYHDEAQAAAARNRGYTDVTPVPAVKDEKPKPVKRSKKKQ